MFDRIARYLDLRRWRRQWRAHRAIRDRHQQAHCVSLGRGEYRAAQAHWETMQCAGQHMVRLHGLMAAHGALPNMTGRQLWRAAGRAQEVAHA